MVLWEETFSEAGVNWRRFLSTLLAYTADEEPPTEPAQGETTYATGAMDAARDAEKRYVEMLWAEAENVAREAGSLNKWNGTRVDREHVDEVVRRLANIPRIVMRPTSRQL